MLFAKLTNGDGNNGVMNLGVFASLDKTAICARNTCLLRTPGETFQVRANLFYKVKPFT